MTNEENKKTRVKCNKKLFSIVMIVLSTMIGLAIVFYFVFANNQLLIENYFENQAVVMIQDNSENFGSNNIQKLDIKNFTDNDNKIFNKYVYIKFMSNGNKEYLKASTINFDIITRETKNLIFIIKWANDINEDKYESIEFNILCEENKKTNIKKSISLNVANLETRNGAEILSIELKNQAEINFAYTIFNFKVYA